MGPCENERKNDIPQSAHIPVAKFTAAQDGGHFRNGS
jgi:hypothetical protein